MNYAVYLYEQAEMYRRHDIRKNPDDLPILGRKVVCYFTNQSTWTIGIAHHHENGWRIDECGLTSWELIAWRYIEPFEG